MQPRTYDKFIHRLIFIPAGKTGTLYKPCYLTVAFAGSAADLQPVTIQFDLNGHLLTDKFFQIKVCRNLPRNGRVCGCFGNHLILIQRRQGFPALER